MMEFINNQDQRRLAAEPGEDAVFLPRRIKEVQLRSHRPSYVNAVLIDRASRDYGPPAEPACRKLQGLRTEYRLRLHLAGRSVAVSVAVVQTASSRIARFPVPYRIVSSTGPSLATVTLASKPCRRRRTAAACPAGFPCGEPTSSRRRRCRHRRRRQTAMVSVSPWQQYYISTISLLETKMTIRKARVIESPGRIQFSWIEPLRTCISTLPCDLSSNSQHNINRAQPLKPWWRRSGSPGRPRAMLLVVSCVSTRTSTCTAKPRPVQTYT